MKIFIYFTLGLALSVCCQAQTICGDDFQLGGTVLTSCGHTLEGALVTVNSPQPEYPIGCFSDNNGYYDGGCHLPNTEYTLNAFNDSDPLNGVTTLDKVIIERHILGIQPLTLASQLIAADVNNDGSITGLDIAEIDQLILQEIEGFSNNTSWRLFDASTIDENDITTFSEEIYIENLDQDYFDLNWIAVKIGDVNCSAVTGTQSSGLCDAGFRLSGIVFDVCDMPLGIDINYHLDSDQSNYPQSSTQGAVYDLDCHESNEDYTLTLTSDDNYLNGVSTLDLVLIEKHILGQQLFTEGWQYIAADVNKDGVISAIDMVELEKLILQEYTVLPNNSSYRFFNAQFEMDINNPNSFVETMQINNLSSDRPDLDWIAVKIGDVNGTSGSGCITSNTIDQVASGFTVNQNQPNPVKSHTTIQFSIPSKGVVSIDLFSLTGRKIYSNSEMYQQGEHIFTVDDSLIAELTSGIYIYSVTFNDFVISKKLIKQ